MPLPGSIISIPLLEIVIVREDYKSCNHKFFYESKSLNTIFLSASVYFIMNRISYALPVISRLPIKFGPPQRIKLEFALTATRGFLVGSKVRLSPKMQEHYLDKPDVESFTVPGAKVFDRYFNLPLGKIVIARNTQATRFAFISVI
jgi:hypothetical protein